MKPFRLAWNGEMFSKRDTWTIIATAIATLLSLLTIILYYII